MIPALLAKIGIPALIGVLSESLKTVDHPAAKGASRALEELDDVLGKGEIPPEQLAEANRHAEEMAQLRVKEFEAAMAEVN